MLDEKRVGREGEDVKCGGQGSRYNRGEGLGARNVPQTKTLCCLNGKLNPFVPCNLM